MTTAEETLSGFVAALEAESLPADVAERVCLHILDAIACGFAGVNAEHAAQVRSVATSVFGAGNASVIGGGRFAAGGAALANGFQIAAPTLGDVHRKTLTHVMPEVLPAALAAAQISDASGAAFLAGVAAGMEVTVRVAESLDTAAYRTRGFHNPGIAGAVGAACAAARVMRLSAGEIGSAVGHATSQAGGTFSALGTDGVKVHQARGGVSGLLAARLAQAGVEGPPRGLTAERGGLLNAYADGGQSERLTDGLGTAWLLMDVALRRWPGASSLQPVIEATLALRDEIGAGNAHNAAVALPPRAYLLNGKSGWETTLAALQSARWTVAVALADGEMWLDQAHSRRDDVNVKAFAGKAVHVQQDAGLADTAARVTISARDGREVTRQIDVPLGDPSRPLTADDVAQKLERAASAIGLSDRVPSLLDVVGSMAAASSVETLTALLEA